MSLATIFLAMAASGEEEPKETAVQPVETDFIMCQGDCLQYTAHIRRAGYAECTLCQNKIYGKATVSRIENFGRE